MGLITTYAFSREFPTLFSGKAHDDFNHFYCIINTDFIIVLKGLYSDNAQDTAVMPVSIWLSAIPEHLIMMSIMA